MPATGIRVHPLRAIEGGRVNIEGSRFLSTGSCRRCASAGCARGSSSPRRRGSDVDRARRPRRRPRPGARRAVCRATSGRSSTSPRRSRPGCIRSTTRCSIATATCTSPTAARAASRCRCRFSASGRTARAKPSRPGIVNPTSMAIDPDGQLLRLEPVRRHGVSCRCRTARSSRSPHDLGVACGLAFAPDGTLFVGDRSGTIFRVDRDGQATTFATLPASVAAFHLAIGPGRALYVTGPTLSSYDSAVSHRSRRHGHDAHTRDSAGRRDWRSTTRGALHVVEALAGVERAVSRRAGARAGARRAGAGRRRVRSRHVVVSSNDTAYRFAR